MKTALQRAVALLGFSVLFFRPAAVFAAQSTPIDPQIVRLSYVEGDVRFNRGGSKGADLGKPWEQAAANLPISSGYAVATQSGRAVVELEDGSAIYLADNSVLLFKELDTRNGMLETEIELLSGTATFSAQPLIAEYFGIDTPTDHLEVAYPHQAFIRVDSFVDGMAVTPQSSEGSGVDRDITGVSHVGKGETLRYQSGSQVDSSTSTPLNGPVDWDQWVQDRETKRQTDTAAALAASGLKAPVPGLIDLYKNGTFHFCAPYGSCWEPTPEALLQESDNLPDRDQTPANGVASQSTAPAPAAGGQAGQVSAQTPVGTGRLLHVDSREFFPPCETYGVRSDEFRDPVTKKSKWTFTSIQRTLDEPWYWAQCHSGGWIHRGGTYHYVVGKKHHRHKPYCWVKSGNHTGFVPRHPDDKDGKPPLNLKHGIIVPAGKDKERVDVVYAKDPDSVKLLAEAPKEFRAEPFSDRPGVSRPEIRGHLMDATLQPASAALSASAKDGRPISFDFEKKAFVRAGAVVERGSRDSKTELVAKLDSHGALMQRPTVFGGGGGTRFTVGGSRSSGGSGSTGGRSSGGSSGGSRGGESNSGGHSGGSGGSGGGGSRGGGGGSSGGGGGGSGGGGSHGGGGGSSSGGGGSSSGGGGYSGGGGSSGGGAGSSGGGSSGGGRK
jgi:FecR protein